jgi:MFS transporter, Spinster family, sphingosine-1-phosphate transporter
MTPVSYRNYLLTSLVVLYAFNSVDSVAIGLALQSIKLDLRLTDTQLGLLTGIAFTLFYAGFGLPMGRWADRGNRIAVLSVTRLLWAVFVILTGRATSFLELLVIRAGTAVGESGCLPPAYSLISDYFSREERPRALGFFYLGLPFASIIGYVAAGWLLQAYGWRVMFTIIGLPGILLALVTRLTLREPRKQRSPVRLSEPPIAQPMDTEPSFRQGLRALFRNATYRNVLLALVVSYFFTCNAQWQLTYFVREYGLKSGILGTWFAIIYGIPALFGTLAGGIIASRWAGGNERSQLLGVAALYCCAGVVLTTVYLTRDYHVAFALLGLAATLFALLTAPLFAALQTVVPSTLRAVSVMIVFFFANLIGLGLGPLFVGATSDLLRPVLGIESLRYALLATGPWVFFSGWFVWRASRSVVSDIEAVNEHVQAPMTPRLAPLSRP